jgi:hypothetical protein
VREQVLQVPLGEDGARARSNLLRDVYEGDDDMRDDSRRVRKRTRESANEHSRAIGPMDDEVVDGDARLLAQGAREGKAILRVKSAVVGVNAVRRRIRAGLRSVTRCHSENFLKRVVRVNERAARRSRHEDPDRKLVGDGRDEPRVQWRARRQC